MQAKIEKCQWVSLLENESYSDEAKVQPSHVRSERNTRSTVYISGGSGEWTNLLDLGKTSLSHITFTHLHSALGRHVGTPALVGPGGRLLSSLRVCLAHAHPRRQGAR